MRKKRTALTGILALLLAAPFFASALTAGELQQQITDLLAQVARLQEQLKSLQATSSPPVTIPSAVGATHNTCPALSRSLSLGAQGGDVLSLQQFLLAQNLLGAGAAQGSFDAATENAVRSWQASHGIVFSGTASSTGYGVVGPRTRALITLNCNLAPAAGSCSLAQPPTTSCSTGWRANTDAAGCVTSYKCALPLPQATSTAGACTAIALLCPPGTHDEVGPNCSHSCVANSVSSTISCPVYQIQLCPAGQHVENSSVNGCSVPSCVPDARIGCPQFVVPYCPNGTVITRTDSNGCSIPSCSTSSAAPTSSLANALSALEAALKSLLGR